MWSKALVFQLYGGKITYVILSFGRVFSIHLVKQLDIDPLVCRLFSNSSLRSRNSLCQWGISASSFLFWRLRALHSIFLGEQLLSLFPISRLGGDRDHCDREWCDHSQAFGCLALLSLLAWALTFLSLRSFRRGWELAAWLASRSLFPCTLSSSLSNTPLLGVSPLPEVPNLWCAPIKI